MLRIILSVPFALFAVSAGVLAGALYFQYFEGLYPCRLCFWQRYPYVALLLLAPVMALIQSRVWRSRLNTLAAVLLLVAVSLGIYHTGVERGWWQNAVTCEDRLQADSIESLLAALEQTPFVPCDQVAWSLFGLSMASYNALIAAGLLGYVLLDPFAVRQRRAGKSMPKSKAARKSHRRGKRSA